MEKEILKELGLTDIEIKVYLELLKEDKLLASEIAKRLNLHRTTSYYILDKLLNLGIISYVIISGKKYFQSISPERLLVILEDKKKKIQKIIPELKRLKKPRKETINVETFKGKEGLKTVWEDVLKSLKKNEEFYVLGSGTAPKILPYYLPQFHNKRLKKKIKLKIVYDNSEEAKKRAKDLSKYKYTQVRLIKKDYRSPSGIVIYDDKVAIMIYTDYEIITSLTINKDVANSFKNYFNNLWKIGKLI